ncbi:hypothetical protein KXD40_004609 [Peronospora effusa]|uniref:WW domain-containing protein n=1 Tax=Peronospora effusa TaxID=542832 RepID=A0A3M6VN42_9STRA|nr:hypothetical protein DD238_004363 [Peronospora effusa]UIZ28365.1 hypothetical protein KXD40_004609 [Peronospora effusa]CAI5721777.1 unnamed protein product [Peronospora effusa]
MAPEPSVRSRRHRSQTRGQSRPRHPEPNSPFCEPSHRRLQHDPMRHHSSPTRGRADPTDVNSRERQKQRKQARSKSRPAPGTRDSRDRPSIKRARVRFSMIELGSAAETLTTKGTCSGFLRKQADNEPGAWNQYYFVVKPLTYLFYYNSKDDETPRGIIDLEYLTDIKRNADCLQRAVGGGDNCFRVSGKLPPLTAEQIASGDAPKMRPLYLDTEDDDKAKEWMNAIRNHRFSLKKDEHFFKMMHQLRDANLRISQLEETQQREAERKRFLRIKAKTLLQKMRAIDSGNMDEMPEAEIDLDDIADDMLAMLEGMEDVLVNLQMKLDQLTQMKSDKAATTSSRRGFTQVLQRAVSRRDNTSLLEIPEHEEEETLAAIRSRRQRNPADQLAVIKEKPSEKLREKPQVKVQEKPLAKVQEKPLAKVQEKPQAKVQEKPQVKVQEKPQVKPQEQPREKIKEIAQEQPRDKIKEKPLEELPASVDNVSDVLAMWKAKKKKSSSSTKQPAAEDGDSSRKNSKYQSVRGAMVAPETGSARKHTAIQKSRDGESLSEEDTASLYSTEDGESGEKLPPGWTKHESRGYPGTYYYANEDGKVSWDVPTDDMASNDRGKKDHSDDRHSDDHHNSDRCDHSDLDDDANEDYGHHIGHNDPEEDEVDICPDTSVDTSSEYLSETEADEETAGGTTSAAYRKQKPKPKSAWAFKLPKLLPTTTTNMQTAAPEVPASVSPIRHGANHHEF